MNWEWVWEWAGGAVVFGALPLGLAALAAALWREARRRGRELAAARGGLLRFSGEMLERHLRSWEELQRQGAQALAAEREEVLRELDRRVEDFRERLRALEGELEFLASRTRGAVERLGEGGAERRRALALPDEVALREIARGLLAASGGGGAEGSMGSLPPGDRPGDGGSPPG